MKTRILLIILFIFCFDAVQSMSHPVIFDKPAFYSAMASSNMEEIDAQIAIIKGSSVAEKDAFEGALLMKKAGMVAKAKEKLSLFKAGRSKLESSISKNKENVEFRFLRLIIQEQAPKILNYRNEMDKDSQIIRSNYKNLPSVVQQAIIDYSKKSLILKPSYF